MRHRSPREFRRVGERVRRKPLAPREWRTLLLEALEDRAAPAVLVAGYGFDEGAGTTVADASGTGNNGTTANTTWSTAGKFGNALSFNGTNALVTIPDSNSLDLTTGMTLEAWVRPTTVSSAWRDVIYKGNDRYYLEATSTNSSRPVAGGTVGSSNLEAVGTTALAVNTWTHLAATYDGANMRLYVNGAQVSSTARTGTIQTSTSPLQIGGDSIFGQYFAGLIDEVRVYNGALTAAQIQADMNTPFGVATPDTQPPTALGNLAATAVSGTQINLSWTAAADNVGVTEYRVERQDPGASSFAQIGTATGTTFSSNGLTSGMTYSYRVRAADAAGNLGPYSAVASATTLDTEPPTVSITLPAANATVTHVVVVSATAADNLGVTSVQFFVDGNSIGIDTTSPYTANWNSTTAANGLHNLTAAARDAAGNLGNSASVSVTVKNPGFVNESVIPGVTSATTMAFLPDGRLLVGELINLVWLVQPGANQPDPVPYLDLGFENMLGEQGLQDIVLDPDFAVNNYFYVFYTKGLPGGNRDRVSRFTAGATAAVPGSELMLWEDDNTSGELHHGGGLTFGNDGKLYIATGEYFIAGLSQQLDKYQGKVLRINKDGSIPTDNPFYDGPGGNKDEIWAYGLRNPFRIWNDPMTGRLYIGDVGGNDNNASIEEINLGAAGANYGWPIVEGPNSIPGLTSPLHWWPHAGHDAAVMVGLTYYGSQFPSEYYGSFFFADFAQNTIKRLTFDAGGNVSNVINVWPADGSIDGPEVGDPVKFAMGPDGSLYYIDIGFDGYHQPNAASIRRIRYAIDNLPPVAAASADVTSGLPPLSVNFSSTGSSDPEGSPLTYSWTFGDGGTSTQANPTHIYQAAGNYTARLSVSDGTSPTLSDDLAITVGNPPIPTILTPTNGMFFRAGDVVNYTGSATDPEDGPLPASAFSWSIVFHHDTHTHPAGGPFTGMTSGALVIPTSGHDFQDVTSYEISLTVTDSSGQFRSTSVTIYPEKVDLSFSSIPSGLTISIDGINKQTPFVLDEIINFQHTIAAANQSSGGFSYTFVNWSDGGAQSHAIVVPASNQSYVATFEAAQPPGLVGAYAFNEGAGTTVADASGTGNNGTTANTTWSTAGKFGNALSFNGINARVTIPDANSLDLTAGMTLEAWVRPSAVTNKWRDVIYKGPDVYYLEATSTKGKKPVGGAIVGSSNLELYGTTALAVNTWAHLAATYDGANMRLYVNGAQVSSTARTGTIQASTSPLQIGGDSLFGQYFAGLIDEVRVYNRALGVSEIQTDMITPIGAAALQLRGGRAVNSVTATNASAHDRARILSALAHDNDYTPDPQPADAMAGAVAARQPSAVRAAGEPSVLTQFTAGAIPAGSIGTQSRLRPERQLDALWADLDLLDELWRGEPREDD